MTKIRIVALAREGNDLLKTLQALECVHIARDDKPAGVSLESLEEYTALIARIAFAVQFLEKHLSIKKSAAFAADTDIVNAIQKGEILTLVSRLENISEHLNEIENELKKLIGEMTMLRPWKALSIAPKMYADGTVHALGFLGTMNASAELWKETQKKFKKISGVHLSTLSHENGTVCFALVFPRDTSKAVYEIITELKITEFPLNQLEKIPARALQDAMERRAELEKECRKLERKVVGLADEMGKLQIAHDFFMWEKDLALQEKLSDVSAFLITFVCWAPKKELENIKEELRKKTASVDIFEIAPLEGEEAPVILRNNFLLAPFETITNLFALPRKGENDPTPYFAPFFITFFGLCLTDAAYGFLIALFTGVALFALRKKLDRGTAKMIKLIFFGGIITFFVSIPFGGWFGMDYSQAPDFLITTDKSGNEKFIFQVINPLEDPNTFMYLALALGAFHVWFGSIIDVIWKVGRREFVDALQDSGFWVLFVPVAALKIIFPEIMALTVAVYVLLALVILGGGKGKSWIMRVPVGAYATINRLIGFMSDTLSYLRLLALGLATGVIALAVNQIALVFRDLIPYVGIVVMIVILIIGHLANIAINVLGAFIHSSRLQFVEFFGKFFEGGGKSFIPFAKRRVYTRPTDI